MDEWHMGPNQSVYYSTQSRIIWKQRSPRLSAIDIELTERCNNNCIHCCINQPENHLDSRKRELSTEQWQALFKQAADLGILTIRFTGGEPLLRDDFAELYLSARRLGLKVLLFTNARLITPPLADLLARVPPLEDIEISAYGMTPESYRAVSRRQHAFAEYQRGIALLKERNIPFFIKGALLPATRPEMDSLTAWSATIPQIDTPPSFVMFLELRTRRDSLRKNRQIEKLRLSPPECVAILSKHAALFKNDMYRICRDFTINPTDILFRCNSANKLCIDAYGKIQFCMGLRHPDTVGDSRNTSLDQYLREWMPKLRQLRSENPDYLRRCARCYLRSYCDQCPALSWSEHGVLDQPVEYLCDIAHEQARYLGLINGDEKGWELQDWTMRLKRLEAGLHGDDQADS